MVSTPSRSSAATRMSLPCIVGPISARSRVVTASMVVLFMVLSQVLARNRGQTKTHDRCQPWVDVEIALRATSPAGIASDDDYQQPNLNRGQNHHPEIRRILLARSSPHS